MSRMEKEYGVVKECKRAAVKTAPFAYMQRTSPSAYTPGGKDGRTGKGAMNQGGKRRSSAKSLN